MSLTLTIPRIARISLDRVHARSANLLVHQRFCYFKLFGLPVGIGLEDSSKQPPLARTMAKVLWKFSTPVIQPAAWFVLSGASVAGPFFERSAAEQYRAA